MRRKVLISILIVTLNPYTHAQNGTIGNPFTSLHQAASVTSAGTYYFNIGGSSFDSHVDANGYLQIAIDFGNGSGNLPQSTSLTTSARGILTTSALAVLSEIREVRVSSSTGNIDLTTTDATIISRIQSNTTLHQGSADNSINDNWTGTNSGFLTTNASCTTVDGTALNQNIFHPCGNAATGFHWIPSASLQREQFSNGEVADGTFFQLWVKGNEDCSSTTTSLHDAAAITTAGIYCFDIAGVAFDTYVDDNGYVQVAIDFGNGSGNIPQSNSLTNATRGILTSTALAALTEAQEVRFSSSTGNIDVTTTDATIISRIQSNTTLHQGTADNSINDNWIGTNSGFLTADASCVTVDGTTLEQNLFHPCGNATTGFHWIPSSSTQREQFGSGDVANATFFQLWVKGDIALPIELTRFDAVAIDETQVHLFWQTASEVNNDYFTVERSTNGRNWQELMLVDGAGNSSSTLDYSVVDTAPYSGVSYYRLKQSDFDGQVSYSPIRRVNITDRFPSVRVYPNPTNSVINLVASSFELTHIEIFNSTGQNVTTTAAITRTSDANLMIDLSQLSSGFYYLKTKNQAHKIYRR